VWLNASNVLLLTSLHEGSPTVVKEALACGLPVVSVDVGDVAERIEGIEGCHLAVATPETWPAKTVSGSMNGVCGLIAVPGLEELSTSSSPKSSKMFYEEILWQGGSRGQACKT